MLVLLADFNGTLSKSNRKFHHYDGETDYYYFQAIHISNYPRGLYTFRSESTLSSYGLLYNDTFDLNNPRNNLVADDYSSIQGQFFIYYFLEADVKYTLVYTVMDSDTTGDFRIVSVGPSSLTFEAYTPYGNLNINECFFKR